MTAVRVTGHLYFIGLAGHTMRGLALAARDLGYAVTGLDEAAIPPGSTWLDGHQFAWWREFKPAQLESVTAVIVTGVYATDDFPAIIEARRRHIPIKSYAQLWGELTDDKRVIDVAGTHGKTTTSALITWLLESAGRHPDFLIGVKPNNFDSSVRLTDAKVAVAEGDEYRASQLETKSKLQYHHPDVLVLTSAEHDHPDFFPDLQSVIERFTEVVAALPADGRLVACADDRTVQKIANTAPCPVGSYGLKQGDYQPTSIKYLPAGLEFSITQQGANLGRLNIPLYGRHNVANALAAYAVASGEGLTFEQIAAGAAAFKGTYRRFTLLTPPNAPITIIDDYAHHPTEVATTLEAAALHFPDRRLIAVFRAHTYSRTAALLAEYHRAFDQADLVYIAEIEASRESSTEATVSGADIARGLKMPAHYIADRTELAKTIMTEAKPGDLILSMTVSGYDKLAEELAKTLAP